MQYNVKETKNKRIQVGHIPLVAHWFTSDQPEEDKGYIEIHFGRFYQLHEELAIKPFQECMGTIQAFTNVKVVKLNPHILDKADQYETYISFRVDLPFGPIISLFITLKREPKKTKHIRLSEQQSYLKAKKICAYEYTLTATGTPLLQTQIDNTINNANVIYNATLLLPKYSEFDIEKGDIYHEHIAEVFIKNNYNHGFHKPLSEAFDYLSHYIHRVTQSNEQK